MIAPMSSTMAAAVRKTRSSIGTRLPIMAISAIANAVSVAMGTPQPVDHAPSVSTRARRAPVSDTTVRDRHAADGRDNRKHCGLPVSEMPHGEFPLDFQTHDQEKDD